MRKIAAGIALALAAAISFNSCGGGGSLALDCAWLASNNCYKTTVAAAATCLPNSTETGTLSADNKTCTYTSGKVVTFDAALALPLANGTGDSIAFTVTSGGSQCFRYQKFSFTSSAGTFTESTSGGTTFSATCPDGKVYSNSNALTLLGCNADAGATLGGLPGVAYSSTNTSISFTLIGTSGTGSLAVFSCQK
jgi:hypothetical protein